MKKTYSAPVVTSTNVTRETLGGGVQNPFIETSQSSLVAAGFGL